MPKYCHNSDCAKEASLTDKFCKHCGTSLTSMSAKPPVVSTKATFKPFIAGRDEDGEEEDEYDIDVSHIDINNLKFDVQGYPSINETIGSVAGKGTSEVYKRDKPYENITPQQIHEELKREAGTSGMNQQD